MTSVGAYEAKTHLARLLDRVARGERITITRNGVPVAELVPPGGVDRRAVAQTIEALRSFRRGKRLAPLKLKDLIEEGRR